MADGVVTIAAAAAVRAPHSNRTLTYQRIDLHPSHAPKTPILL